MWTSNLSAIATSSPTVVSAIVVLLNGRLMVREVATQSLNRRLNLCR
jgi:hypothetical protein